MVDELDGYSVMWSLPAGHGHTVLESDDDRLAMLGTIGATRSCLRAWNAGRRRQLWTAASDVLTERGTDG